MENTTFYGIKINNESIKLIVSKQGSEDILEQTIDILLVNVEQAVRIILDHGSFEVQYGISKFTSSKLFKFEDPNIQYGKIGIMNFGFDNV